MRCARSVIGLPIISLAEGLRVGEVRDLVFDPEGHAVAALVANEATWRHDAELIPMEKVRSFGRDAVTISDLSGLIAARSRRELYQLFTSGVRLDGLLAMTEGGNYLGIIEEVLLGPHGEMLAYEISIGFATDINRGKCHLPATESLTVGRDVATFPDALEELLDHATIDDPAKLPAPDIRALRPLKPVGA